MHKNESYLLFTLILPSDPRDHHNKSMKNGFINLLKITRLPFLPGACYVTCVLVVVKNYKRFVLTHNREKKIRLRFFSVHLHKWRQNKKKRGFLSRRFRSTWKHKNGFTMIKGVFLSEKFRFDDWDFFCGWSDIGELSHEISQP